MSIVFLLLPIGLLMTGIAIVWFVWSVRHGQYDDLETPPVRMLFEEDQRYNPKSTSEIPED